MGARPIRFIAGVLAVAIVAVSPSVRAQTAPVLATETPTLPVTEAPAPAPVAETPPTGTPAPQIPPIFQAEQLDQMLAPIALYPDALLAQILMASTYPLEIVKAHRWFQDPSRAALQGDPLAAAIEAEAWDPSVKALVAFPQILRMMDANLDWTERLGDAFLAQQADVMDAIQRLRQQAAAAGTLWSNAQQRVTTEGQGIVIEPAIPTFIYPPVYNPAAVYGPWPYPDYPPLDIVPPDYGAGSAEPFDIGFGAGFAVVQPLWRWCAFDWAQRRIRFQAERARVPERTDPGLGSAIWQHDPAHRRGVPFLPPASRERFAASRDHAVSMVTFPRVTMPNSGITAPTVLRNLPPRTFAPARSWPAAHFQPQRSIMRRQFIMPQMAPNLPTASLMPRAVAASRGAPPGGGLHFEGASHR